jgi:hypothetical protein
VCESIVKKRTKSRGGVYNRDADVRVRTDYAFPGRPGARGAWPV